jgi:hypothetical protein
MDAARGAALKGIAVRGAILTVLFGVAAKLAPRLNVADPSKPIDAASGFAIVAVMLAAGAVWWSAWNSLRRMTDRPPLWVLIAFAVLFRATVFFSPPILELDVYRYLWDGYVSTQGVNPFRFSPSEVQEAVRFGDLEKDDALRRLATEVERNPVAAELVALVHFPDLTTVYATTSQGLFAACAWIAPQASLQTRLLVMKAVLVGCELTTWVFLALLLRRTGKPAEWLILPMWCPLAVLSVANQGHLDSLPAFLTTAALVAAAVSSAAFSGILLALACGAKVYPMLVAPLVGVFLFKSASMRTASAFVMTFLLTSVAVWSPVVQTNGWRGFRAFAGHWEMHDAAFAIVIENLKSDDPQTTTPWYVVTSNSWVVTSNSWRKSIANPNAVARGVWLTVSTIIALVLAARLWHSQTLERLLRSSFLLLVWFWALGPVCNPWYLLWMLPLLPFGVNSGWMTLFVLAPAMFLRFPMAAWFGANGEWWYDHGIAFVIAATWMTVLAFSGRAGNRPES